MRKINIWDLSYHFTEVFPIPKSLSPSKEPLLQHKCTAAALNCKFKIEKAPQSSPEGEQKTGRMSHCCWCYCTEDHVPCSHPLCIWWRKFSEYDLEGRSQCVGCIYQSRKSFEFPLFHILKGNQHFNLGLESNWEWVIKFVLYTPSGLR